MATRTAVITSHIAISHLPGQQKEQRDARTGGKDTPPVAFISGNGKADHRNVQRVVSQFVPAFVCQNTVSHRCLTSHSTPFPRRRQQGGGCVQGSGPALHTPSILAAGPQRPVGFPPLARMFLPVGKTECKKNLPYDKIYEKAGKRRKKKAPRKRGGRRFGHVAAATALG